MAEEFEGEAGIYVGLETSRDHLFDRSDRKRGMAGDLLGSLDRGIQYRRCWKHPVDHAPLLRCWCTEVFSSQDVFHRKGRACDASEALRSTRTRHKAAPDLRKPELRVFGCIGKIAPEHHFHESE